MPQNVKKNKNKIVEISYYLITAGLGCLFGVIFSNWSYFKFDEKIHVHEILSLIVSSFVALYIGGNIQKAIVRSQYGHEVLLDEIKRIISSCDKFEIWLEDKKLPFEDSKKFFKKTTVALKYCQRLFSENDIIPSSDFQNVINKFTLMKQNILAISPISGGIPLDIPQADDFSDQYNEIRKALTELLIR